MSKRTNNRGPRRETMHTVRRKALRLVFAHPVRHATAADGKATQGEDTEYHELMRRIRRLEHCCQKLENTTAKLATIESDLHNRARDIEKRVHKLEDALLGKRGL